MMMSRHCFRPTVRTCTGLFVLAIFAMLVAISWHTCTALFSLGESSGTREKECVINNWNSATSESQHGDSESLEARSKDGKVLGSCSLQRTEVSARVSGYLAKASIIQNFVNLHSTSKGDVCEQSLSNTFLYLTNWIRDACIAPNPLLGFDAPGLNWAYVLPSKQSNLMSFADALCWSFIAVSLGLGVRKFFRTRTHEFSPGVLNVLAGFVIAIGCIAAVPSVHSFGVFQFEECFDSIFFNSKEVVNLCSNQVARLPFDIAEPGGTFLPVDVGSVYPVVEGHFAALRLLMSLMSLFLLLRWLQFVFLSIQFFSAPLFFSLFASLEKQELAIDFVWWSGELSLWSMFALGTFKMLCQISILSMDPGLKVMALFGLYALLDAIFIFRGRTLILRYCELLRSALAFSSQNLLPFPTNCAIDNRFVRCSQ